MRVMIWDFYDSLPIYVSNCRAKQWNEYQVIKSTKEIYKPSNAYVIHSTLIVTEN